MFLDTSGLLCFLNHKDSHFAKARDLFLRAPRRLTHSYVLAELLPLARVRGVAPAITLRFLLKLGDDPSVSIKYIDRSLHERAIQFLQHRADKHWSLCDAASFILMEDEGISEALTTDHDFEQAGFMRLL